jgi:6-phosphogluconolactonase (cycloisomerase 2 family)
MPYRLIIFLFFTTFFIHVDGQVSYLNAIPTNGSNSYQMALSADGRFAYIVAENQIQSYERNPSTGQLTFMNSIDTMDDGTTLYEVVYCAVSPGGDYLYVEGSNRSFVFSRDSLSGELTPLQTLSENFHHAIIPVTTNNIEVSKDSRFVYFTASNNLLIYQRDSLSGMLSLIDTIQNLNYHYGWTYDVSILLSSDNEYAFFTGGIAVSVYKRDPETGLLTFKNIIEGDNFQKKGLNFSSQSVITADGRFLYVASNSDGSGAIVLLEKDSLTDTLTILQTIPNQIRPGFVYMTSDERIICLTSGITFNHGSMIFFERDSVTGMLRKISEFMDGYRFGHKKFIDFQNKYLYSVPFSDSVFVYKFNLFLDSAVQICDGDSVTLTPWKNHMNYSWSTGSTASSITVSEGGSYTLTAEDQDGSVFTEEVEVISHPLPFISLGEDFTLYPNYYAVIFPGFYESYLWNRFGETDPYFYYFNDSVGFGTEMITCIVSDSNGCFNTDTILITRSPEPIPIVAKDQNEIFVYPNPFTSMAHLQTEIPFNDATLTIFNSLGEVVKKMEHLSGRTLYLWRDSLPHGIYFLSLMDAENSYQIKIVIGRGIE